MTELKNIIVAAQKLDQNAMYEIITRFSPTISKYAKEMRYDEDFRSDMILHLIETVYSIDLAKFRIPNDYAIINYISNTLYHQYIYLSRNQVRIRRNENHFENDQMEEWLGIDESTSEKIDYVLLDNTMKQVLTKREYYCVKLMIVDGIPAKDVAGKLGISRQTVNENKNRGLKKLRLALK